VWASTRGAPLVASCLFLSSRLVCFPACFFDCSSFFLHPPICGSLLFSLGLYVSPRLSFHYLCPVSCFSRQASLGGCLHAGHRHTALHAGSGAAGGQTETLRLCRRQWRALLLCRTRFAPPERLCVSGDRPSGLPAHLATAGVGGLFLADTHGADRG